MKYNYYEYDGSVIVATDGSIRDNNIHMSPVDSMDSLDDILFVGVRLKRKPKVA